MNRDSSDEDNASLDEKEVDDDASMISEDNNIQDMPIQPNIGESGDDTIGSKAHVT